MYSKKLIVRFIIISLLVFLSFMLINHEFLNIVNYREKLISHYRKGSFMFFSFSEGLNIPIPWFQPSDFLLESKKWRNIMEVK